jgi:chemotaxis protein CheD
MSTPEMVPGLERVERYWDASAQSYAVKLRPGEYYVTAAGETLVTVVGTTLAVYLFDQGRNVAGMSHFALPRPAGDALQTFEALDYGRHALELLIAGVQRQGARRGEIGAFLVGASDLWSPLPEAQASAVFARRYLNSAGIAVIDEWVGAFAPQKVWATLNGTTVVPLDTYGETIRWREDTYLGSLDNHGWAGELGGSHTFSEHRALLRHLRFLEGCTGTAGDNPTRWVLGVREGLRVLEELLLDHTAREERELYPWLARTLPMARGTLRRLQADHAGIAVRLAGLRRLAAAPTSTSRRRLAAQLPRFIADLRTHEGSEGELLAEAYTRDATLEASRS